VYFGSHFPVAGCDHLNTWIEAERQPRYWGAYTFKDGAGIIKMPFGEIPIRAKVDGLVMTTSGQEHAFVHIPSVDGTRFNGTYVMNESYEKIPVITFAADGRFNDEGALLALDHDYYNPFSIVRSPGSGTYSVKDHTVTFRYDDGRTYLLAFPGVGYDKTDSSPRQFSLGMNEDELRRQ
jgi:hypothetical protein